MRLKSGIWVAAYIRRCNGEGASAVVRRRGADEAGAIFIKLNRLDGTAEIYGPAPQTAFDESHPIDRFGQPSGNFLAPADASYMGRAVPYDRLEMAYYRYKVTKPLRV